MSTTRSSNTRSGFFIRQRFLETANSLVEGASKIYSNVREGEDPLAPRAPKVSPYTQEKCLVFPGYAFVKNNELTVNIEGFAFGLRPLGAASRTQKLFVSGARQLAALPGLPKGPIIDEPLDIEMPPEELQDQLKTYNERHKDIQAPTTERPVTLPPPQSASTLRPPKRQDTASSIASTSSTVSKAAKITNVTYSQANLETLHDNLNARLRLFFSQKLVGRRIRVSIFLQPQEHEPEKLIARGTLMTELGGVFKSAICVPWQNGEPAGRKLRVRTELLTDLVEEETIDDQSSLDRVMARSDEASVGVTHAHAPIRVISDIDDTIKATHVLAGIKSVFRNVFTRPHEELTVDGMQQWYRSMQEEGACFHYVSNSPFELFGVLREYMLASGYPPGSVRLKEYGGGSGSLFGGLWEPAGERKRNGVEEILKTFPDSRFLLVGDSGEQDLELYVSLAKQYPHQILGIFIRDVTSPLPRFGSKSANSSTASLLSAVHRSKDPVSRRLRRDSDTEQEEILTQIAKEEKLAVKASTGKSAANPNAMFEESDSDFEDTDPMSLNNPLDRNSIESASLAPLDEHGYTEGERRVIMLFKERIDRARQTLPKGIPLKIFKSGEECQKDAAALIQGVLTQGQRRTGTTGSQAAPHSSATAGDST